MSDTQNVLDKMTSAIVGRKQEKAAALTPVGSEKGGPLDGAHPVAFPFDNSQMVQQAIIDGIKATKDISEHLAFISQGLNALATHYGVTVKDGPAPMSESEALAAREREADREHAENEAARVQAAFERDFAEKQARAQAAAFGTPLASVVNGPGKAPEAASGPGWECPTHGLDGIRTQTSRKGRTYRSCVAEGCREFER